MNLSSVGFWQREATPPLVMLGVPREDSTSMKEVFLIYLIFKENLHNRSRKLYFATKGFSGMFSLYNVYKPVFRICEMAIKRFRIQGAKSMQTYAHPARGNLILCAVGTFLITVCFRIKNSQYHCRTIQGWEAEYFWAPFQLC